MFLMTMFFLKNDYTYMKLAIKYIPKIIIDNHNLKLLIDNGYIYYEITGRIYSLPHTAQLSLEKLYRKYLCSRVINLKYQ